MSSSCPLHPASRRVVEHPLSPTSISRTRRQLHLASGQSTTTHDSSGQEEVGNIQTRSLETDPMLPRPATTHTSSSLLVSSTDPIIVLGQLDHQGVVEGYQADQTIETADTSPSLPPPPPASSTKNPSLPAVPFSKRLFHAFVHKPTLSRTWEKKAFMDEEKKSAPAAMGGGESLLERDDHDLDGWWVFSLKMSVVK